MIEDTALTFQVATGTGEKPEMLQREEILRRLRAGELGGEAMCWNQGMTDWLPLRQVFAAELGLNAALEGEVVSASSSPVEFWDEAPVPPPRRVSVSVSVASLDAPPRNEGPSLPAWRLVLGCALIALSVMAVWGLMRKLQGRRTADWVLAIKPEVADEFIRQQREDERKRRESVFSEESGERMMELLRQAQANAKSAGGSELAHSPPRIKASFGGAVPGLATTDSGNEGSRSQSPSSTREGRELSLAASEVETAQRQPQVTPPPQAKPLPTEADPLRQRAEQGDAEAQYRWALTLFPDDPAAAITWLKKAAAQDHAEACFQLGEHSSGGRHGVVDPMTALGWYRRASELGHMQSRYILSTFYEAGYGAKRDAVEAMTLLRESAEGGYAEAQYHYGGKIAGLYGAGTPQHSEAMAHMRKAAAQDHAEANYYLGVAHYTGLGAAKDGALSLSYLRKAVQCGALKAWGSVGLHYLGGSGSVERDDVEALACFIIAGSRAHELIQKERGKLEDSLTPAQMAKAKARARELAPPANLKEMGLPARASATVSPDAATPAAEPQITDTQPLLTSLRDIQAKAEAGDPAAQYKLGCFLRDGFNLTKNAKESRKWFQASAEKGHADGQFEYGWCLLRGVGGPKDEEQGALLLRKAAAQGQADAMAALGDLCEHGDGGLRRDAGQAFDWYHQAAEAGLPYAMLELFTCYMFGRGVTRDEATAEHWLRKAAAKGLAAAEVDLGYYLLQREGASPKEATEGALWYRKAAEHEHPDAMLHLGLIYWEGRGVPRDPLRARYWLRQAAIAKAAGAFGGMAIAYAGMDGDRVEALAWTLASAPDERPDDDTTADIKASLMERMDDPQKTAARRRAKEILIELEAERQRQSGRVDATPQLPSHRLAQIASTNAEQQGWRKFVVEDQCSFYLPPDLVVESDNCRVMEEKSASGTTVFTVSQLKGPLMIIEFGKEERPMEDRPLKDRAAVWTFYIHTTQEDPHSSLKFGVRPPALPSMLTQVDEVLHQEALAEARSTPSFKLLDWNPLTIRRVNEAYAFCLSSRFTLWESEPLVRLEYRVFNGGRCHIVSTTYKEKVDSRKRQMIHDCLETFVFVPR